ncbi:MAG: hypothetical protein LUH04_08225 [Clostridium sp.]|nr:hypothetical protein [Clostridium sp.]
MSKMTLLIMAAVALGFMASMAAPASAQEKYADADNFYQSDKVTSQKVMFPNQYKMNVVGNLFLPPIWIGARSIRRLSLATPWAR